MEYGRDFDEAREHVEELAPREGWRYVHSANEPHLIAGVGTLALEIFDELPDVDCIFTPVGGGSGAVGLLHRPHRARLACAGRRRAGVGCRRVRAFMARTGARDDRSRRSRCRRHGDENDLRPDVFDSEERNWTRL